MTFPDHLIDAIETLDNPAYRGQCYTILFNYMRQETLPDLEEYDPVVRAFVILAEEILSKILRRRRRDRERRARKAGRQAAQPTKAKEEKENSRTSLNAKPRSNGYNALAQTASPTDLHRHGTHSKDGSAAGAYSRPFT